MISDESHGSDLLLSALAKRGAFVRHGYILWNHSPSRVVSALADDEIKDEGDAQCQFTAWLDQKDANVYVDRPFTQMERDYRNDTGSSLRPTRASPLGKIGFLSNSLQRLGLCYKRRSAGDAQIFIRKQ